MVERSECSRWLNEYKNFPISLEINFHLKYIVSFDHKEQFARIDNFVVIKNSYMFGFLPFRVIYVIDVIKTLKRKILNNVSLTVLYMGDIK